ncbi:MAG: DUF1289 domain-containing protein [Salinivirgaceae bacterium]|jgi:predicted Fe-S protein YdhL (DUF1289 family)|nr:DUF1289 domain-containing protein [Salinivirgaceae bacterium]
MNNIESPCISICRYDSKGMCYGCKRTMTEIGDWLRYTPDQRAEIIENLSTRKNAEEMPGFSF